MSAIPSAQSGTCNYSNPERAQKKPQSMIEAFFVIPLVQNSNSFLEDLRRLNQLKDTSLLNDTCTKPTKHKKSKLKR